MKHSWPGLRGKLIPVPTPHEEMEKRLELIAEILYSDLCQPIEDSISLFSNEINNTPFTAEQPAVDDVLHSKEKSHVS